MAKTMGFSTHELNDLSIGQVLDQSVEWVNAHKEGGQTTRKRKATQADFDNF